MLKDEDENAIGAVLNYADQWAAGIGVVSWLMTIGAATVFTLFPDADGGNGLFSVGDKLPFIGDVLPNEIMLLSSGTAEPVTISIAAALAIAAPAFILGTDGAREVFGMVADDDKVLDRPANVLAGSFATVLPLLFLMFDVLNSAAAGSPTVQAVMAFVYSAAIGLAAKVDEL